MSVFRREGKVELRVCTVVQKNSAFGLNKDLQRRNELLTGTTRPTTALTISGRRLAAS